MSPCSMLVLQAADSGGTRGGEAASQPDSHANPTGGLPENDQPAGNPGPAMPPQQLPVRPPEPAALDRKHRKNQQCVSLRVG